MAASVRIEDEAFCDVRYEILAKEAGLVDADHARGKMARIWRQCTQQGVYVLPPEIVRCILGDRGPEAIIKAGLGEEHSAGIRIRGTAGRIEWIQELRKKASAGGRARAKGAKRDHGRFSAGGEVPPEPKSPKPEPAVEPTVSLLKLFNSPVAAPAAAPAKQSPTPPTASTPAKQSPTPPAAKQSGSAQSHLHSTPAASRNGSAEVPIPTPMTPPTLVDVTEYCRNHRYAVDPKKFVDHYTTNGWKEGGAPITDWRAMVRQWQELGVPA